MEVTFRVERITTSSVPGRANWKLALKVNMPIIQLEELESPL